MEESYSNMINNKSTCESICRYMLNTLLSGPNPNFNSFIERIKNDIDSGIGLNNHMPHDDLATAARAKYNNMVASDEYSKLYPRDAKILALKKSHCYRMICQCKFGECVIRWHILWRIQSKPGQKNRRCGKMAHYQ